MRFARQEKAEMSKMDLNKTIRDSVKLVEHQISISGIKIQQNFALEGAPIWMMGNPNQVQQVMMNLMLNAQQAMENKGSLSISTTFDSDQKKATVVVSDTGPGMSAEVKSRIFEPFFTTKGAGKGTGLGLSVTLGIVKDHSGVIEVDSEIGRGTTFQITLPADVDQAPSNEQIKVA
jgi:signal transduction histidine kinase